MLLGFPSEDDAFLSSRVDAGFPRLFAGCSSSSDGGCAGNQTTTQMLLKRRTLDIQLVDLLQAGELHCHLLEQFAGYQFLARTLGNSERLSFF
jgi:hypothetical protein